MVSMRAIFVSLVVLVACGTKINPDVCCTDTADCAAKGVPDGSMCTDGLVCRGNSCIAETCVTSDQCEPGAPFCSSSMLCSATCALDSECPGFGGVASNPYCESGACVECRTSADCSSGSPICRANGSCGTCSVDADCPSRVCRDDGTCSSSNDVAYLDAAGADAGACTQAAPCRTLGYTVSKTSDARYTIAVAAGLYLGPLDLFTAPSNQLEIHGGGASFSQPEANDGIALNIRSEFQLVSIRDAIFTAGGTGTALSSGSPLALRRVTIKDASQCLIASNLEAHHLKLENCTMTALVLHGLATIDGMEISGGGVGISSSAALSLKNVLVHDTIGHAAEFLVGSSGTVSFSTVVNSGDRGSSNMGRAVTCMSGSVSFISSIVWAPGNTAAQAISACALSTTIAGPTPVVGATSSDPLFFDPATQNYHLTAGSPAIDVAPTGPPTDRDDVARPQGLRFDLGSYEYKP